MKTQIRQAAGFAVLEVLLTLLIMAFGMIALLTVQHRAMAMESEAQQRAQAVVLLTDIAERVNANRTEAAAYEAAWVGAGQPRDCDAEPDRVQRDLCEWANLLRGATVIEGTAPVGAMHGARGCIVRAGPNALRIAVAWQGFSGGVAPSTVCGEREFGADDGFRRAISIVMQVADLDAI
ncbi:MAG TPA: type IV pilus modification protein PilV [Burkholderiaceae bacterium]|nr:type IV pilus modification protein PilV [Burkholderiaceae bacterium]